MIPHVTRVIQDPWTYPRRNASWSTSVTRIQRAGIGGGYMPTSKQAWKATRYETSHSNLDTTVVIETVNMPCSGRRCLQENRGTPPHAFISVHLVHYQVQRVRMVPKPRCVDASSNRKALREKGRKTKYQPSPRIVQ